MLFNTVSEIIGDLKNGKMVIIVDDESRENEGDLVLPADFVTAQAINFMSLEARGLICLALTHEQSSRLGLSLMVSPEQNLSPNKTAFTVTLEAAKGISTGISPADRARTIAVAANPLSTPKDIITPGHVFPIRAHKGGVLKRAGHTEASVDFCRLAGLNPAAVICEIINPDGSMSRVPDLKQFAQKHQIKIATIEDLIRYRITHESFVEQIVSAPFESDTLKGFTVKVFWDKLNKQEHLAFVLGPIDQGQPILTRVHSACLTGDVFGGTLTKSGQYLNLALQKIQEQGAGVLVYLCLEGKGQKLSQRVNAYLNLKAQHQSKSRLKPVKEKGALLYQTMDEKDYGVGAQILRSLGISKLRLMSQSAPKRAGLKGYGLEIVETVPLK